MTAMRQWGWASGNTAALRTAATVLFLWSGALVAQAQTSPLPAASEPAVAEPTVSEPHEITARRDPKSVV